MAKTKPKPNKPKLAKKKPIAKTTTYKESKKKIAKKTGCKIDILFFGNPILDITIDDSKRKLLVKYNMEKSEN